MTDCQRDAVLSGLGGCRSRSSRSSSRSEIKEDKQKTVHNTLK